ncbi:unnamed protein product [Plutella xylostella]|uniref:(diamondback moth) hypothetical protein n=1 Tax=Plutella xylostella TaxID=51655 RepID=A0A8S4EXF4_PLUXY|nr:unnamed protein product [Plutella xylostella]
MPSALVRCTNGYATTVIQNTRDEQMTLTITHPFKTEQYESSTECQVNSMMDERNIEIDEILTQNLAKLRLDHMNAEERQQIHNLCMEYKDIFYSDLLPLSFTNQVKHFIRTKNEDPIYVKPYRQAPIQAEEIKKQVENLLKNNVIQESFSPWSAPVHLVPKKMDASGEAKYRMVIDYRRLNDITIDDKYPLPNITDLFDKLGKSSYFSTLDLASGYHQIEINESDRQKTAFSTQNGHYEFLRMPFGLKTAPATFQRAIDNVLRGLQGIHCLKCKELLTNAPLLQYPDPSRPYILTTDASSVALGAVLSQGTVGSDQPIAYASRALSDTESRYSTIERELLAIIWAVKHFRPYLYGHKFLIYTDHRPLSWLYSIKEPNSKLTRWRLRLLEYDFEVIYKNGKQNTNADALSRIKVNALTSDDDAMSMQVNIDDKEKRLQDHINDLTKNIEDCSNKPQRHDSSTITISDSSATITGSEEPDNYPVRSLSSHSQTIHSAEDLESFGIPILQEAIDTKPNQILVFVWFKNDIQVTHTTRDNQKVIEAIEVTNRSTPEVIRALIKYFSYYGIPKKITCDPGKEFNNELMKELMTMYKIDLHITTPNNPNSTSIVERFHSTIIEIYRLAKYDQKCTDAASVMTYAILAYNNTIHSTTELTPFEVVFGHTDSSKIFEGNFEKNYMQQLLKDHAKRTKFLYKHIAQMTLLGKEKVKEKKGGETGHEFATGEDIYVKDINIRKSKDKPRYNKAEVVGSEYLPVQHPCEQLASDDQFLCTEDSTVFVNSSESKEGPRQAWINGAMQEDSECLWRHVSLQLCG